MKKVLFFFTPGTSLLFQIGTKCYSIKDRQFINLSWRDINKKINNRHHTEISMSSEGEINVVYMLEDAFVNKLITLSIN